MSEYIAAQVCDNCVMPDEKIAFWERCSAVADRVLGLSVVLSLVTFIACFVAGALYFAFGGASEMAVVKDVLGVAACVFIASAFISFALSAVAEHKLEF